MSVSLPKRRSTTKTEIPRTVLIAIPNSVEFCNYESNRLYQVRVYFIQTIYTFSYMYENSSSHIDLSLVFLVAESCLVTKRKHVFSQISIGDKIQRFSIYRRNWIQETKGRYCSRNARKTDCLFSLWHPRRTRRNANGECTTRTSSNYQVTWISGSIDTKK